MNVRTKFIVSFFAICVGCSMVMMESILLLPRIPMLRFVPLIALIVAFVGAFWLIKHYRGRLPSLTPSQRQRAIRANRQLAWMYLGGLALGLATQGKELSTFPHGVGYLIPLIPIGLATLHFRAAAQLSQKAAEAAGTAEPN
jgi:hypothetical protein